MLSLKSSVTYSAYWLLFPYHFLVFVKTKKWPEGIFLCEAVETLALSNSWWLFCSFLTLSADLSDSLSPSNGALCLELCQKSAVGPTGRRCRVMRQEAWLSITQGHPR